MSKERLPNGESSHGTVDTAKARIHPDPAMPTVHATCVVLENAVGVLLRGPSGSGKSDLALRLIDGGAWLVGDDYCDLSVRDGGLFAAPAPALAGLLEVRGLGLVRLPHVAMAAVHLVVDLLPPGQRPERLPEPAARLTRIAGVGGGLEVTIPALALDPFTAAAPAVVRLAARVAAGDIVLSP